jgi:hypothetical protein
MDFVGRLVSPYINIPNITRYIDRYTRHMFTYVCEKDEVFSTSLLDGRRRRFHYTTLPGHFIPFFKCHAKNDVNLQHAV